MRLIDSNKKNMARAGHIRMYGLTLRFPLAVPSAIRFPHEGVGRATERPRKANDPSSTMTPATVISPKETAAGMTLGRISRRSEEHTSELQSLRHLVCRL